MGIRFFLSVASLVMITNALAKEDVDKTARLIDLHQLDRDKRQVALTHGRSMSSIFCCGQDCCTAGSLSFSLDSNRPSSNGSLPGVILNLSPASVDGFPNGQAHLKVTFDKATSCPACNFCLREAQCQKTMLKITVQLAQQRAGWLINIGDSATNNGYAGDWNTQNNDAEFQLVNDDIRMYKSDVCHSTYTASNNFISPASTHMVLYISNNRVLVEEFPGGNRKEFCENCLFALNGQPDPASGGVNQDIYIAFHRVVSYHGGRIGRGIRSVHMNWECPIKEL